MLPSVYLKFNIFFYNTFHFGSCNAVHQDLFKHREHPHCMQMYHKITDIGIHLRVPELVICEP